MSSEDTSNTSSPIKHRHSEQILSLVEPIIYQLDEHVQHVTASQTLLNQEIDHLLATVEAIKANADLTLVLEEKSKKLVSLKRRLTLIHSILQNANERCRKLMANHKIAERK